MRVLTFIILTLDIRRESSACEEPMLMMVMRRRAFGCHVEGAFLRSNAARIVAVILAYSHPGWRMGPEKQTSKWDAFLCVPNTYFSISNPAD